MEFVKMMEYEMSRLALGTVQFGMDYGIANATGRPSEAEVQRILSVALRGGVNVLDTAYAYGESEAILGRTLWSLARPKEIIIITKLTPMEISPETEEKAVLQKIMESLSTSLGRLRLDYAPIFMLHQEDYLTLHRRTIVSCLRRLKERGLIKHIGASIYTPEEADLALSTEGIEVIQIPFNVLDRKLERSRFLGRAKSKGIMVLARSVFLKGLVLMESADVPGYLQGIIPYKERLNSICRKAGRTVKEVALKFPLTREGIASVIVGVDNAAQMEEDLTLLESPPLDSGTINEIEESFNEIPEYLVNPNLWKKEKQHLI